MFFILLLLASSTVLIQGSSTAPKHILVQVQSPDGDLEVFGKDIRGGAVKAVFLEQTESPAAIVTLATDGRMALVKSEYNRAGQLIDCELIENRADIDRFTNHVEENIQRSLTSSVEGPRKTSKHHFNHRDLFNVVSQAKACQQLLLQREEEEEEPGRRAKRSYLIWPGTNWCGKGSKAEFADSYGPNKEADQCCQKHDQCPYMIEGFTTRYNLFNYRIHTLSHCDCDRPFMNCLKNANTSTSNTVGKVYFNVVNTECFELSLQKTCAKRSWWGGCDKYTTKWTAAVKSLGSYPEP